MEQTKYDVFISYSRKDYVDEHGNVIPGNEVSRIMEALTNAGISYWFDQEGIYSGNEFTEKIVANIDASLIFLFLSTKNSNASSWTSKEIACADEMKKYIIPVRIDHTPYNKKVLFRIADRSYVDYEVNPDSGMKEIINSINIYKEQIELENKRKEEEERQKQERERKRAEEERKRLKKEEARRQKEQKEIVSQINLQATTLNNEEAKLQIDRENLLLQAENIADVSLRESTKLKILEGGPIHKKYKEEYIQLSEENKQLKCDNGQLTQSIELSQRIIEEKDDAILKLNDDLNNARQDTDRLGEENEQLKSEITKAKKSPANSGFNSAKFLFAQVVSFIIICIILFVIDYDYAFYKYKIREWELLFYVLFYYQLLLFVLYSLAFLKKVYFINKI